MRATSLLLLLLSFSTSAQITLSIGDFSDAGDTVRITTAQLDLGIDYSSTGPNHTWDFSGLVPSSQELRQYNDLSNVSFLVDFSFGSFAASDYQATNFAKNSDIPVDQISQFLPVTISEVNLFSKNSVDSITSLGFTMNIEGNEVPVKSDTIETRYKFPLDYQDNYQSRGYTYLDMNPIYNGMWIQHKQRSTVVDGWGSITTPYGTFDVLRINHAISESDSVFMEIFSTPTWISLPVPNTNIYEWIALGEKEPVLRVTTSEIMGNETITSIEYRDTYLGLDAGLEELNQSYTVYPNPIKNVFTVEGLDHMFTYVLYDINGQEVAQGEINGTTTIDISSSPAGQYLLFITDGQYKSIRSVIKE